MPNDQIPRITALPSRYEPLVSTFGERAKMTFVPVEADLEIIKRLIARSESAGQGKLLLLRAAPGAGKSTFVHSLEVFLSDRVSKVVRLPPPHELSVSDIPGHLATIKGNGRCTVVNFDGREAPVFDEGEYRTFLGNLNGLLRHRKDLIILWPVTDADFAAKIVGLLEQAGGKSAFGNEQVYGLQGLRQDKYNLVLEKILQVANWRLEDAAISNTEVDQLIAESGNLGAFLDSLQGLIAQRFDVDGMGVTFPTLVLAISSGEPKIREVCRSLRRADSFYLEASRLLMYTRRSNVADWWNNRSTHLRSALPHVIALFNAQLVSLSASAVVHSILQFGEDDLQAVIEGVRADKGNARRVIEASELHKYVKGEPLDQREYGSNVKDETFESFARIQQLSKTRHRAINKALLQMVEDAGSQLLDLKLEHQLVKGLASDATYSGPAGTVSVEFHHKAADDSNSNKVSIYILEKLKEYSVNYGLAER